MVMVRRMVLRVMRVVRVLVMLHMVRVVRVVRVMMRCHSSITVLSPYPDYLRAASGGYSLPAAHRHAAS